jgi:hypothetical protein
LSRVYDTYSIVDVFLYLLEGRPILLLANKIPDRLFRHNPVRMVDQPGAMGGKQPGQLDVSRIGVFGSQALERWPEHRLQ